MASRIYSSKAVSSSKARKAEIYPYRQASRALLGEISLRLTTDQD